MAINNEKPEMENENMENTRTNIDDFLTVRGFGGYGAGYGFGGGQGMYPGNSMLAAGAHADGTALKTAVDCNASSSAAALDRISAQNEETRRINSFDSIRDGMFQSELRNGDRLRDVERLMVDGQKEAAKCCCDLSKEVAETKSALLLQSCEDKSEILAAIAGSESRAVERSLNAANAELTALKTQIACGCCNDHHHPH